MARRIKRLIKEKVPIFNPKTGAYRPIQYSDIVILLRSMPWAPEIMEQFKHEGIPIYANLSTGYFDANRDCHNAFFIKKLLIIRIKIFQ